MANANNYVDVASTTNAHDTRIKPEVFEDLLWGGPDDQSVAALFDKILGAKSNSQRKVMNQKFTSFHEWPHQVQIEVTADVAAGSSKTISVDDANYVRKNMRIHCVSAGRTFLVSADPTSSTSISTASLPVALSAGDKLLIGWKTVPESWQRPKPLSRNTESHEDYCSTIQTSFACSWHNKHTGRYGEDEYARIDRSMMYEFKQEMNRLLLLSEPVDGTSTGRFEMAGLRYMGKTYNKYVMPGVVTQRSLFNVMYTMRKYGKAKNLVFLMGQRLLNEFALANRNTNVITTNTNMTDGTYGAVAPEIVTPIQGVNAQIMTDEIFDTPGMDREILVFNLDLIDPVQFGDILLQKPSAQNPQGVADVGTGDMMSMITRSIGLRYRLPQSAVALVENVDRIIP